MAITINKQPVGTNPVYNDLIYIVESNKVTEANFKFICDVYVYISGAATKVHRMSAPPHPTYGVGVFNPARIIENYINNNFDLNLTAVTQCLDSATFITMKFGEEYGLSTSGTTVYPDLATSNTTNVYNGVFDWEDFCDYDYTIYRSSNSSSQFLTNSPDSKKVYTDENEYLYAINRTSGDIYYFNVDTYDSNGLLNGSFKIINPYQARSNSYDLMVRCPAGWNLNDIPSGSITVSAGALPILDAAVYTYDIKCIKFDGTTTIGYKRYALDTTCERFTKYRLHFLNKLGGYDSFSFTKKSNFLTDIKRENYKSNLGELASISTYTHSKSQRAITQYATNIEDRITIRTDFLTSGDILWLEELVTSPDVYVEKNGAAVPITITNSSFDRQNGEDKKLFTLTLEFKYSYKRYRQRF
jgi:hypothetical protein